MPGGHEDTSGDVFGCHQLKGTSGKPWAEVREALNIPEYRGQPLFPPATNWIASSVNKTETEKLQVRRKWLLHGKESW